MSHKIVGAGALSENLIESMDDFRQFIGADSIEYIDRGNSETLVIHKNDKTFQISACGNKFDGGFFGYIQK